jgi:hypothetical protein
MAEGLQRLPTTQLTGESDAECVRAEKSEQRGHRSYEGLKPNCVRMGHCGNCPELRTPTSRIVPRQVDSLKVDSAAWFSLGL